MCHALSFKEGNKADLATSTLQEHHQLEVETRANPGFKTFQR